jgi:hypothetical protein
MLPQAWHVNSFMDVRGRAAGAEIVRAALRAHLAERGSGKKVSSGRSGALDHAGEAGRGEGRTALTDEDEG